MGRDTTKTKTQKQTQEQSRKQPQNVKQNSSARQSQVEKKQHHHENANQIQAEQGILEERTFIRNVISNLLKIVMGCIAIIIILSVIIAVMACNMYAAKTATTNGENAEIEIELESEMEAELESDTEIENTSEAEGIKKSTPEELMNQLVEAEAGGESPEGKAAAAAVIWNRAGKKTENLEDVIFEKYQFEPADTKNRVIRFNSGKGAIVTNEDVSSETVSICGRIRNGDLESPIGDWKYFVGYTCYEYSSSEGKLFAKVHNITEYKVIENQIFFPEWTKELNHIKWKSELELSDLSKVEESIEDEEAESSESEI